jgi:hypothetical protein
MNQPSQGGGGEQAKKPEDEQNNSNGHKHGGKILWQRIQK